MGTPETYPCLPIPDQSNQKSLVMDPGLVLLEFLVYFYIYLLVSFKASQVIHMCSQPVNHIGDQQSWVTWEFLSFSTESPMFQESPRPWANWDASSSPPQRNEPMCSESQIRTHALNTDDWKSIL